MNEQPGSADAITAEKSAAKPWEFDSWRPYVPIRSIREPAPVVSVIRLSGIIGAFAMKRGLSIAALAPVIERAFSAKHLKAVALVINSPGGSPVQSRLIYGRIRQLADEKAVPVVAFVEDAAASGGYWLALAADEIFADESSIVGSIGVISSGFGFTELIGRIGVERRLHTAGERKSLLDPFRPERPEDVERLKAVQREMHAAFIEAVRTRRVAKLKGDDATLFSGEFWTGKTGLALGLIDGIGEIRSVMRARFGERLRFRVVEARRPWTLRFGRAEIAQPADWIDYAVAKVEEKLAWTRLGL